MRDTIYAQALKKKEKLNKVQEQFTQKIKRQREVDPQVVENFINRHEEARTRKVDYNNL